MAQRRHGTLWRPLLANRSSTRGGPDRDKGSLEAVLVIQREKLLAACVIVTFPAGLAVLRLLKFCALCKTALNISPGLTIPKTHEESQDAVPSIQVLKRG